MWRLLDDALGRWSLTSTSTGERGNGGGYVARAAPRRHRVKPD